MVSVLHLIDSLSSGGAERVAVNLANEQAKRGYQVTLCASRRGGPLEKEIAPEVHFINLQRRFRFDLAAFARLIRTIKEDSVQIIHAHSSSIFIAALAKRLQPGTKVIWHDHYGGLALRKRSTTFYRPVIRSVDGVIAVNQELAHWSIDQLGMQASMVRYIPNFVVDHQKGSPSDIPGVRGYRIVNVANLRPQKDHLTLIQAMKIVTAREPKAHLILVGSDVDKETSGKIWKEIASLDLSTNITWLGLREDVQDILINCDIGIISSVSEGLPLALLEYGQAGLAVISTNVGECPAVLDQGKCGILVPPQSPQEMADGLLSYLHEPAKWAAMASAFHERVVKTYSANEVLRQVEDMYQHLLNQVRLNNEFTTNPDYTKSK